MANMIPSLDVVTLHVPQVLAAHSFYAAVFSSNTTDQTHDVSGGTEADREITNLDMHGTGQIALVQSLIESDTPTEVSPTKSSAGKPTPPGFPGYTFNYIVSQPSDVRKLLGAAVQNGATVLKPAKKALFAGFSAVFQSPDGAVWKLASSSKKDTGPTGNPPLPVETTAVILGITDPKASKSFYASLGMVVDRDYGSKYVDFRPNPGTYRLGLMPRQLLASDAGVKPSGASSHKAVFTCKVSSQQQVDDLLNAAVTAGGQIAAAAKETAQDMQAGEQDGYWGYFTDPDGFLWNVTT